MAKKAAAPVAASELRAVLVHDPDPKDVKLSANVEFLIDGIRVYRMQYTGQGRTERIAAAVAEWEAGEKGWVRRILDSTETREKVREGRLAREAEEASVAAGIPR